MQIVINLHIFGYLCMPLFFTLDNIYNLYKIDPLKTIDGMVILDQSNQPNREYEDHRHQFDGLLLSFLIRGTMKTRIHFLEYDINPTDIVVILPQLMIDVQSASEDAEMITIGLSLDFIASFPNLREFIMNDEIRWHPVIQLKDEDRILQQELLSLLQKSYHKKPSSKKKELLQHLLFALISLISEAYSTYIERKERSKNRTHEIIDDFYVLISKYAIEQRSVKFYADKLHLTPQYLSTLLKKATGKSVLQWIDHILLMHAKTLLKSTNISIKELSNQLHFADSSLFCRYFKRHTGISPKSFRNAS